MKWIILSFDDFPEACTNGDSKDNEGWKAFNENF